MSYHREVTEAEDDPEVRAQLTGARPELDPIVRSVLRANAEAALFDKRTAIEVGRYQLVREIGTGGGGSVFLARDPELDREIALKLIVGQTPELRARALAEGQALARLSHPNIVPVFDVGIAGERVYLVMELVRGESLRAYAAHASRREIVAGYRQAGEGLAAAHEAGLVHRDFKPDNAVTGRDGRVRVIDFGLAQSASDDAPRDRAGTPRYMAPEQRAGKPATPATDQYAFAVSLREAVGDPLPGWLETAVRRAASEDPAARFPSMAALLKALANDPRKRWGRRAVIATPIVLAIAGFAVGRGGDASPQPCDGKAALVPAWTPARSNEVMAHVQSLETAFASTTAPRARDAIDRYAASWIESYSATCAAARRKEPLAERRAACLARARGQLGEAITLLGSVAVDRLPAAMTVLSELPDLAGCADASSLVDNIAPPPAAQAKQVEELAAVLDRAHVAMLAADPQAVTRVDEVVRQARALGYRPLLARALLAAGRAELATDQRERAIAPLTEATEVALGVGDHATAVEAFARAAWAKLMTGKDVAAARQGLDLIAALANQLGPRGRFARALLHNNAGTIENAAGNVEQAREQFELALKLARDVAGPGSLELAAVRSNLALVSNDAGERERLFQEHVSLLRDRLGDDHPLTLDARYAEAISLVVDARARDTLFPVCDSYARQHPKHGAMIVECAVDLLWLQLATGDTAGARASAALALAATGDEIDPDLVAIARSYAALLDGDVAVARSGFDELARRVAPGADAAWWQLLFAADVEIGRVLVARAARTSTKAALTRALHYLERAAEVKTSPMITRRLDWARRAKEAP